MRTDAPTAMWVQSALLPTGARVVPRGAPVTNLIRYLGRGFFALHPSLTKPPKFETSLFLLPVCNYRSRNQFCGQSHNLVSLFKVSFLQGWRVSETKGVCPLRSCTQGDFYSGKFSSKRLLTVVTMCSKTRFFFWTSESGISSGPV